MEKKGLFEILIFSAIVLNKRRLYLKIIYAMDTVGRVTFLEVRLFTFIDYFYSLIRLIKK